MTLILAIVPVLLLIVLMAFFKMPGDRSSVISLIVTMLIALFGFHFAIDDLACSFLYGALKAVSPILIIIVMAIFSYNVLLKTRKMEIIKQQFTSISTDKSIQVLLLTWGFGGLLEAMAGFGTAVAIPAAILISLGFKPVFSAVVSLIANSVATAFGAIGTPVLVLAKETSLDVQNLSTNVVLQLSSTHVPHPIGFAVPHRSEVEITSEEFILSTIGRRRLPDQPVHGRTLHGCRITGHYRKYSFDHRDRHLRKAHRPERRTCPQEPSADERYSQRLEHLPAHPLVDHTDQSSVSRPAPYTRK